MDGSKFTIFWVYLLDVLQMKWKMKLEKKNYNCDVTYGTNNEFGFDYLRDNMKYNIDQMVQRNHFFCIVDEVDSIYR